jgi:two-component system response regulator YesN
MHEKQFMAFSIINFISKAISNFTKGVAFEYNENEFVGIVSFNQDIEEFAIEEKIEIIANDIKNNINNDLKISVTIGIGEWVDRIEKIPFSYQRAMFAANQKLTLGKNRIIYVDITKHENEVEVPLNLKDVESIYIALRLGSYERAEAITNEIFNKLKNKKSIDKQYIHGVCLQLISVVNRAMNEFYEDLSKEQINIYDLVKLLFKLETLEDIKTFMLSNFKKICDEISKYQRNSSKRVIDDIKSIIYEKYDEDISINSLAKDVYLTPSYICLLFKQETGETINDFLTNVRIEKAKELINGKMTKLYEVSKKVGYSDPKYFSKLFKKLTGVNPSEYNKSNTQL